MPAIVTVLSIGGLHLTSPAHSLQQGLSQHLKCLVWSHLDHRSIDGCLHGHCPTINQANCVIFICSTLEQLLYPLSHVTAVLCKLCFLIFLSILLLSCTILTMMQVVGCTNCSTCSCYKPFSHILALEAWRLSSNHGGKGQAISALHQGCKLPRNDSQKKLKCKILRIVCVLH